MCLDNCYTYKQTTLKSLDFVNYDLESVILGFSESPLKYATNRGHMPNTLSLNYG